MTLLFLAVALLAALFALPGGKRGDSDRRLAQTIAFAAVASALFVLKLGVLGGIVSMVGVGLYGIGWLKDRVLGDGFQDLSEESNSSTKPAYQTSSMMDYNEALAVLGLSGKPHKAAIIDAHRRMIAKAHPDSGGSDYLASKVNEARDVLLTG